MGVYSLYQVRRDDIEQLAKNQKGKNMKIEDINSAQYLDSITGQARDLCAAKYYLRTVSDAERKTSMGLHLQRVIDAATKMTELRDRLETELRGMRVAIETSEIYPSLNDIDTIDYCDASYMAHLDIRSAGDSVQFTRYADASELDCDMGRHLMAMIDVASAIHTQGDRMEREVREVRERYEASVWARNSASRKKGENHETVC